MPKLSPKQFWITAAQWGSAMHSGDPGSCMYGFDERGVVQSEEHRQDCIAYIEGDCRKAADTNVAAGDDPAGQHPELDALLEYLKTAPVDGANADIDSFTKAYLEEAIRTSQDNSDEDTGGDFIDNNYSIESISTATVAAARADCDRFRELCGDLLTDDNHLGRGDTESAAARDFWLTRNGYGAGFWDGDWKEPAESRLTEIAKSFGEVDIYIGDDGKIYSSGDSHDNAADAPAP
jgi:hypothetical protein